MKSIKKDTPHTFLSRRLSSAMREALAPGPAARGASIRAKGRHGTVQRGHARLLLAWLPLAQPAPVVWRARSGRRARSGSAPEQEGAGLVRVHHGAGGNEQRRLRVGRQRCPSQDRRSVAARVRSATWRQRGAGGVEETVRVGAWFRPSFDVGACNGSKKTDEVRKASARGGAAAGVRVDPRWVVGEVRPRHWHSRRARMHVHVTSPRCS